MIEKKNGFERPRKEGGPEKLPGRSGPNQGDKEEKVTVGLGMVRSSNGERRDSTVEK